MPSLNIFRSRLRDRLAAHINDTFLTDPRLDGAINVALQQSTAQHDWPWLQTNDTVAVVAGTASYDLPSDFLRMEDVVETTSRFVLLPRGSRDIDELDPTQQGFPRIYNIYGNFLEVRPSPSPSAGLFLRYYRIENTLISETDTSLIPDPHADGVVEYATYLLFRATRESDKAIEALAAYKDWIKRTEDIIQRSKEPLRVRVRPGSDF